MKVRASFDHIRYMQYVCHLIASFSAINYGMYHAWSSPSIPKFASDKDSPIDRKLTPEERSWLVASFLFGVTLGSFFGSFFIETFGRKLALIASSVLLFFPWMVMIFVKSLFLLVSVRFVAGMGGAIVVAACPVYSEEITDKDIRRKLGTTFNLLKLTGSLYVLCVGPFISYTALAISCSVVPVTFAIIFYFMPESPYYLVKVGKPDRALKNLKRLSSNDTDNVTLQTRLDQIYFTVYYDIKNKLTMWEFLSNSLYRKSFLVMLGVKTLEQFSGINAIVPYLQTIVQLSKSSMSPEVSSIICGCVQIPAVLASAVLVDRLGRKPLLIISALGSALALIVEGTYFYLAEVTSIDLKGISWLPTVALMFYLIMNPLGVYTLPYVLSGEIFAPNTKVVATTAMTIYGAALAFLSVKYFEPASRAWGMYTTFWIFAGFCISGAIFVFFFLPETKGKSLLEIQQELHSKK